MAVICPRHPSSPPPPIGAGARASKANPRPLLPFPSLTPHVPLLHTAAAAMPLPWEHAAGAGALPLPRRALLQGDDAPPSPPPPADPAGGRQPTPPGRCKVLALPCVASVLGQSGAGPCSGPATFDRDNT